MSETKVDDVQLSAGPGTADVEQPPASDPTQAPGKERSQSLLSEPAKEGSLLGGLCGRCSDAAPHKQPQGSLLGSSTWLVLTALQVLVAFFTASEATRKLSKTYYNVTTFCDSEDFFPSPESTHKFGDETVLASNCTNYWYAVDNRTLYLCKDNAFRCALANTDQDAYYVFLFWVLFAYGVTSFCAVQLITILPDNDGARTRP